MSFILTIIANAISLFVLDIVFSNIQFANYSAILITALALTIVNAVVKPILKLLSLPLTIITLGLFSLVVNAIVLLLAFKFSNDSYIAGFGTAIFASIILGIINPFIAKIFDSRK